MQLVFSLIFVSISVCKALLLPFNSSVLRLPSQDSILATGETNAGITPIHTPWPSLPYLRYIKNGLVINITAYGDSLSKLRTPNVLQALPLIQRVILDAGEPNDTLEDITTVGDTRGHVYTEIGFYALHPPGGITRSQAGDVLHKVWQLLIEFFPAKEITLSSIIFGGEDIALFRLSFSQI